MRCRCRRCSTGRSASSPTGSVGTTLGPQALPVLAAAVVAGGGHRHRLAVGGVVTNAHHHLARREHLDLQAPRAAGGHRHPTRRLDATVQHAPRQPRPRRTHRAGEAAWPTVSSADTSPVSHGDRRPEHHRRHGRWRCCASSAPSASSTRAATARNPSLAPYQRLDYVLVPDGSQVTSTRHPRRRRTMGAAERPPPRRGRASNPDPHQVTAATSSVQNSGHVSSPCARQNVTRRSGHQHLVSRQRRSARCAPSSGAAPSR